MLKQYWSILGGVAVTAAALMMSPGVAMAQHGGGHGGGGHGGGGHGGGGHGGGGHTAAFSHGGGGFGGHAGWAGHGGSWEHGGWGRGDWGRGGWDGHRGFGWGGWGWGWGWPWYGYGWYGPGWGGRGYGWGYGYPYSGYDYGYPYSGYDYSYAPSYYGYGYSNPSDYYGYAPDNSLDYSGPAYGSSESVQPATTVDNRAHIRVLVPADARLWFEGQPTKETGSVRLFNTPPLQPGHTYTYDVRAQWRQGNQTVTRDRQVVIYPGDRVSVDFLQPTAGNQPGTNRPGNPNPVRRQANPPPAPAPRTTSGA